LAAFEKARSGPLPPNLEQIRRKPDFGEKRTKKELVGENKTCTFVFLKCFKWGLGVGCNGIPLVK
jgi:hypothetical protein